MELKKLKGTLEVAANIAVLLVSIAVVFAFTKDLFIKTPDNISPNSLPKGGSFSPIEGINYSDAEQTLVLALNTNCPFCTQSIPFYKKLLESQRGHGKGTRIVSFFVDKDEKKVEQYLQSNGLHLQSISAIDLSKYNIKLTPTLVMVGSDGKVIESWVGKLQADREQQVIKAITEMKKAEMTVGKNNFVKVEKTVDLFDETNPLLTIQPKSDAQHPSPLGWFDIDNRGNTYLLTKESLSRYDSTGKLAASMLPSAGFGGVFCVNREGTLYMFNGDRQSVEVYSSSFNKIGEIPLSNLGAGNGVILKMLIDQQRGYLYLQMYINDPLSQILYRVNLKTNEMNTVFQLDKPVPLTPFHSPGAFDFTIGATYLYISDIYQYKIYIYSLSDSNLLRSYTKPFSLQPITEQDGKLTVRKMTLDHMAAPGLLHQLPPIFHLNFTGTGKLLVWTSQRNEEYKQIVDVYTPEMEFIGQDLKYSHPTKNSYVFANGKVYVPDFGFGGYIHRNWLSPLEVTSLPLKLTTFSELSF